MERWLGRVCLVTGASAGIGAAVARGMVISISQSSFIPITSVFNVWAHGCIFFTEILIFPQQQFQNPKSQFFFSQKASLSPLVLPNPNLYTPMSGLGPFPGVSWLYLTFQTACYQYPGKEGYTEDCWTWPENQIIKMRNLKNNLFYITTVSSPCVNFINL